MSNEELVLQIQAGDNSLMETLWEQNKALVYTTVKKYAGLAELDDLIQEGYLGLCNAVESFNPAAGVAFSTYAVKCIQRNVIRYLKGDSIVKVAEWQQSQVYKWQQLREDFLARYNREPTEQETCYLMRINYKQLADIQKAAAAGKVKSLDAPVTGEEEITLSELVADPNNGFDGLIHGIDHQSMKKELWEAVDGLDGEQATVIRFKYQDNLTAKETGELLGIKESQVRSLESKGLRSLRRSSVSARFKPYYEEYMAAAYHRTSLSSFRNTWSSSEEWHILQREKRGCL